MCTEMSGKEFSINEILKKYWGYDGFRPLQDDIIKSVLEGRDTLGLMPTGGGKSITFQVPTMAMDGLAVVVTPIISLMKDQVDNLIARRIIFELEGEEGEKHIDEYSDGSTERGKKLRAAICEKFHFDSIEFQSVEGVIKAIGIDECELCTYCWTGKK